MTHWTTEFDRCAPWIREALASGTQTHTLADVFALIASGEAQLHSTDKCCIVTVMHQHQNGLKVVSGWCAGGDLEEIKALVPKVEQWARQVGCTHVMIRGRLGWKRAFASLGYELESVTLAKDLRNVASSEPAAA